ncbi:MAG TPA: acetate kinase [candidate division Zixibacteria bacterium]|nr:acetate kinase [candidate division Zixibacteria bacterium]
MKVLVLNCGSSTIKFQLIELEGGDPDGLQRKLARGIVDRIGAEARYRFEAVGVPAEEGPAGTAGYEAATRMVFDWVSRRWNGFDAVGHRVVHGGERFTSAVRIDDGVVAALDELCELAPLHNPASVAAIRFARSYLGGSLPMVAAFDTSFHHTIPGFAAAYALPRDLAARHRVRRYGFHGLAHQYSAQRYAELTGTPADRVDIVTLHLGNGCSACAIRGGKSVETSMGFTPLEGLIMGTRSGDLDPALVGYLARKEKTGVDEIERILNHESGLRGLSGFSSDMRDLAARYDDDPRARLAVDAFCHRARKYLGAYLAVVGGARAVVFSGGIGENAPLVRARICAGMEWCGLKLDEAANAELRATDSRISAVESALSVYVVHTDEERIIARETTRLLASENPGSGGA